MVVQFTDAPVDTPHGDLVGLLRPQLSDTGHGHVDAGSALLRALCVALPKGHAAVSVRRAVLSIGTPEQVSLAHSRPTWARLVRNARERVAEQGSDAGQYRNALSAARITVARVTTPLPPGRLSPRREALVRRAFAVTGVQLATLRFDKVVVSSSWLALQLGISPEAARQTIKALVELGWLSPAGRRGQAGRYRLRRLETEWLRDRAWLHSDSVEEIASGSYATPLAELLAAASHAAFGFGVDPLTTQVWVTMLHDRAGLAADETLGVSSRSRRQLSKRVGELGAGSILELFDCHAAHTGAFDDREAAEAAFRKRAADNSARLKIVRDGRNVRHQLRQEARAAIQVVVADAGVPPVGAEVEEAQMWVRAADKKLRSATPTIELTDELEQLLTRRQWTETMIASATRYLLRGSTPTRTGD